MATAVAASPSLERLSRTLLAPRAARPLGNVRFNTVRGSR
jgi:hypothetical protein